MFRMFRRLMVAVMTAIAVIAVTAPMATAAPHRGGYGYTIDGVHYECVPYYLPGKLHPMFVIGTFHAIAGMRCHPVIPDSHTRHHEQHHHERHHVHTEPRRA